MLLIRTGGPRAAHLNSVGWTALFEESGPLVLHLLKCRIWRHPRPALLPSGRPDYLVAVEKHSWIRLIDWSSLFMWELDGRRAQVTTCRSLFNALSNHYDDWPYLPHIHARSTTIARRKHESDPPLGPGSDNFYTALPW